MTVYLFNLAFSLNGNDFNVARFAPHNPLVLNPTISNLSCAWFQYLPSGTPNNLGDYYATLSTPLDPAQWGRPQGDQGSLAMNPGDFLMFRVYSVDSNAANYQVRFTGVFGRGTGQAMAPGAGELQSPLVMSSPTLASNFPRAVIDVDGTNPPNWPGPIPADNSWVTWVGGIHPAPGNAANDYVLNVGASVYVNRNIPAAGNLFTFGHDPRMHVGGTMKRKQHEHAA